MFTQKSCGLDDLRAANGKLTDVLFDIFTRTLNPGMRRLAFQQYYFAQEPECFEVSFLYHGDTLAGFCSAVAYEHQVNGRRVVVFRTALGVLDEYRYGSFPLGTLFGKYIRYKLLHPFTPVYIAGFIANPFMYNMISSYTRHSYPRPGQVPPARIRSLKEELIAAMGMTRKEVAPFVLRIHFQVRFTEADHQRFHTSEAPFVRHFLKVNPGYDKQMGLLTLVPVTLVNIGWALGRLLKKKLNLG